MKNKVLLVLPVVVFLSSVTLAQKSEIRIVKKVTSAEAFPGQLLQLYVDGISSNPMTLIPSERFQVVVTQEGVSYQAKVRSAAATMLNMKVLQQRNSSAEKTSEPNKETLPAELATFQGVLFTVPQGLREGEATAVVIYRDKRSDEFQFKVVNKPLTPKIWFAVKTVEIPQNLPTNKLPGKTPPKPIFERGQEEEINLTPLVDPETPDSAVLVTFKQSAIKREVFARVERNDPKFIDDRQMNFGAPRYIVTVTTPLDLLPGEAEMEVRLRAHGFVSEPDSVKIEVADFTKAEVLKPVIMSLSQSRIGVGQSVMVFVNDIKRLVPNPMETRIILEQNSQRIVLKPERNSAEFMPGQDVSLPVFLVIRIGKELIGNVTLRVFNPARGEQAGLSDSIPLEIVNEVVPPTLKKVNEATNQDLSPLRMMRQMAIDAGRDFPEYNPNARYVTITAFGLDFDPNNLRIRFIQGGKEFTLKFADYSVSLNEMFIVRLPDEIIPGLVQVAIQNKADGRWSEAVTKEFEVTKPNRK
ncbi:MAG: hypothetical protein AB1757_21895 [Acidobacteriota bacterium]